MPQWHLSTLCGHKKMPSVLPILHQCPKERAVQTTALWTVRYNLQESQIGMLIRGLKALPSRKLGWENEPDININPRPACSRYSQNLVSQGKGWHWWTWSIMNTLHASVSIPPRLSISISQIPPDYQLPCDTLACCTIISTLLMMHIWST
jgi:hypothetical protein